MTSPTTSTASISHTWSGHKQTWFTSQGPLHIQVKTESFIRRIFTTPESPSSKILHMCNDFTLGNVWPSLSPLQVSLSVWVWGSSSHEMNSKLQDLTQVQWFYTRECLTQLVPFTSRLVVGFRFLQSWNEPLIFESTIGIWHSHMHGSYVRECLSPIRYYQQQQVVSLPKAGINTKSEHVHVIITERWHVDCELIWVLI